MTQTTHTKVLVIGLDAVDPQVLLDWCDSGCLPTLSAIRERGAWGLLETPTGMADDAVWASFSTCVSPAEHCRYHFRTVQPGSYQLRRFRRHHFNNPPFWEALSNGGKRVAIIDVPKSPATRELNGIEIRDWRVHGNEGTASSIPPELAEELFQRFGDDMTDRASGKEFLCGIPELTDSQRKDFFERLRRSIADKTTVAKELLSGGDWDLFLAVYKEGHCAGHQCWPPDADLKSIYRSLDGAVADLLQAVDQETTVIVFSNLGMRANHTGEHLLDKILQRLENLYASSWHGYRAAVDKLYHGVRSRLAIPATTSRYRSRLAFPVDFNEMSGAIRINQLVREPDGRIRPGADTERFTRFLETQLLALKDPDSDLPIVEQVLRSEDLFPGYVGEWLPDLFVVWNRSQPIVAATSPAVGIVSTGDSEVRPGNHIPGGIYFACGPTVEKTPCNASIVDIGPTIAALLGVCLDGETHDVIDSIGISLASNTTPDGSVTGLSGG
ncbi:MAG: alkaline phosphatase family protein [Pseudomonadales bacterium]